MTEPDKRARELTELLCAPFPPEVIEIKPGGGNKKYIGHEVIRQRIIASTDNQFDWKISNVEYREDGVLNRTDQKTGELFHPTVMVVTGELTIFGLGTRSGQGVQALEHGAGEDTYKAAESDAFKRAAMAFGIGLDQLYTNAPPVAPQRRTEPTPIRTPDALTDKQFSDKLLQAMTDRDGQAFRELSAAAGKNTKRWKALIQVAESEPVLDWVLRQMERFNVTDQNLLNEADARRGLLKEGALASV
jgi:hypothetical protein